MKRTFKVINKKVIYQNKFMTLEEYATEVDGKPGIYSVAIRNNGSVAIVERADGKFLMVRQYRFPANQYGWEFPMGGIESGELPETAAERELKEETGVEAELKPIGTFVPSPGLSPARAYVFYGRATKEEITDQLTDEITEIKWFDLDEINEMVLNGEITDGWTISSLCQWWIFRDRTK